MQTPNSDNQNPDIVFELALSPAFNRDGICFAARSSGLYRSADGGKTWQYLYNRINPASPLPTTSIALSHSFANDGVIYAAVPGGILRSDNGGIDWTVATLPTPTPTITTLCISPEHGNDGLLFAGTLEDGVFRSSDRGATWAAVNIGLFDYPIASLAVSPNFSSDKMLFAGCSSGIFLSQNGGLGWRDIPTWRARNSAVSALACSPDFANDQTLFAAAEDDGLFCSTDLGSSWTKLAEAAQTGAISRIILSPNFTHDRQVILLNNDAILLTDALASGWQTRWQNPDDESSLLCLAGPLGGSFDDPFLVGTSAGAILKV